MEDDLLTLSPDAADLVIDDTPGEGELNYGLLDEKEEETRPSILSDLVLSQSAQARRPSLISGGGRPSLDPRLVNRKLRLVPTLSLAPLDQPYSAGCHLAVSGQRRPLWQQPLQNLSSSGRSSPLGSRVQPPRAGVPAGPQCPGSRPWRGNTFWVRVTRTR